MKTKIYIFLIIFTAILTRGQGTFIYDQQSAVEGALQDGGGYIQNQVVQSFTPVLSSVDFVRLWLGEAGGVNGATIYVNLLSGSITGTVIGTTAPVSLPVSFNGYVNFFFPTDVSLTPGASYYFQPIAEPGSDLWYAAGSSAYNYQGGQLYYQGIPKDGEDLWFREGIYIAPEPSASWLVLIGSGVLFYVRRRFIH
jgi:hypothetical protein